MAPRRPTASSNSLSPQGQPSSSASSSSQGFPRSTSPSNGFTSFLSKPSKWFGRSASNPKIAGTSASAAIEPRASSSSGRKHKISRPTDPRPILQSYATAPGARSVMDLSSRNPNSLDLSSVSFNGSQPSSPLGSGFGDLRAISKRAWSRSADDLSKLSTEISPAMGEKITQYRNRSNSNSSALLTSALPSAPPVLPRTRSGGVQPFPSMARTDPPNIPTVSISISAPAVEDAASGSSSRTTSSPTHVHTRSHSFTPKLAKLSAQRFMPPSPKRKGSSGSEVDAKPPSPSPRSAFPFSSSSSRNILPESSLPSSSQPVHHSTTLLAPPNIVEPFDDGDNDNKIDNGDNGESGHTGASAQKRASQIVHNTGFINKFADGTVNIRQANLSAPKAWKPFKLELKGSKLYFYKPPSDRTTAVKELFPTELVPASQQDDDGAERGLSLGKDKDEEDIDDPFAAGGSGPGLGSAGAGTRMDMRSSRQDNSIAQRKKRAFWGRRTHPDLVVDADGVEKGTFEALTHEAVFSTTFFGKEAVDSSSSVSESVALKIDPLERWKSFASSVLLTLPYLIDRAKFEAELMRCCEYLVTGAENDEKKAQGKARVVWLAGEYAGYHGRVLEFENWDEWKEIKGDLPVAAANGAGGGSAQIPLTNPFKRSPSTQALFNPTPLASPNVGTFSPRPEEATRLSLLSSLNPENGSGLETPSSSSVGTYFDLNAPGLQSSSTNNLSSSPSSLSTPTTPKPSLNVNIPPPPWASALDREGLSRDVLLLIDPNAIAKSLGAFHTAALQELPENLTAELVFNPEPSHAPPLSSLSSSPSKHIHADLPTSFVPLFGSDDHPHWLTKLLLVQILGADTSTGYANTVTLRGGGYSRSPVGSPGSGPGLASGRRRSDAGVGGAPGSAGMTLGPSGTFGGTSTGGATGGSGPGHTGAATSRTHSRSEVISAWIKIGELCRLNGDECSWRAVFHALCSMPVARLDKAWKRVELVATATVESWVRGVRENEEGGESIDVPGPRKTPWGGNLKGLIREELSKAAIPGPGGQGDVLMLAALDKVRVLFEGFRTSVSLCPQKTSAEDSENGDGEEIQKLVSYWKDIVADGGAAGGLANKFHRLDQFMSLSLAAEPRRKGLYEPFYWAKSTGQSSSTASLTPLLFQEPLPSITLLDRSQLARGRVDSDTTDFQHLRAIDGHLRPEDRRPGPATGDGGALAVLNQGGTVIPVYNGDILLVVQNPSVESTSTGSRPSSLVRSRPPSSVDVDALSLIDGTEKFDNNSKPASVGRKPSIRVKPGSSTSLERKSSLAKRNSLPSLSQRQPLTLAENSSEPPLRVLVQAGTLDRLVAVLVHGLHNVSVSVADDNGEMSLRVGMTRELLLDHKEFSRIWWNVFRSFVTPLIFFELLRKIYIKSQPSGSSPLPDQYLAAISSKSQVLETIKLWLTKGGGAQDVLDDSQLSQALRAFFASPNDHLIHSSPAFLENSSIRQAWDGLTESRKALARLLRTQTMRPFTSRTMPISRNTVTTSESRVRNLSTREPPDIDRLSPEEFVDNIDGMAFAAFNNVTEEDLYITSDLLEVQSADRTGWFPPREPPSLEDQMEIQTIHSYLQEVEPSSLISELSPESLYRLLPPGIRSCIRAHSIVRKWIISKVVAPRLGLRTRQARLEFLLQVIEVARLRNTESSSPSSVSEQPCVRSFVEAAVTSAILSPECRLHQRAWQNVAALRGCNYETLTQLLVRPNIKSVLSKDPLTVDMGWQIERILDVIAMPDLVESHNEESQNLVNFDKRRNLCNFISNAPSLLSRRLAHQSDINRRGFERLNNIEREIFSIQFDLRGIKDEAYRESTAASTVGTPSKKISRPFQRLLALQGEKYRRDRNLRMRLQKEKMQEQSRNEKREEQLNRAMKGERRPITTAQKQHRNKKSMSALFSFMRPISSAFGADTTHAPTLKRTASELDFVPSGKPTLVLNLTDSRVAQFINNDRSFTFQLDTEDGGHYLLQTMSKRDMIKWIETLSQVSKTAAKRRLTYIGNSPKPRPADHIHDHPTTATRDPRAVFGVELDFLLQRENGGSPAPPGAIPSVIERCIAQVESRGLTEVGIYRIAGAKSENGHLTEAFNRGENPLTETTDIHAICDLIKSWFRTLPKPLFPPSSYYEAIETIKLENLDDRLSNIRKIVHSLPPSHFDLLKLISEHLDRVTDYEEHNQMTAEALSIVFSPNLLRAPQNDFMIALTNMQFTHKLVKTLITHYHVVFDEADAEAEADAEDELDTPIAEDANEDNEEVEGEFTSYLPTSPG